MCKWIIDNCVDILSLLVAIFSFFYSMYANRKSKAAEEEVNSIKANLEASNQYSKVKELERPFEGALSELIVILDSDNESIETKKRVFLKLNNRFTDLFNEINSFCALINNDSICAKEYLKNTAIPKLVKYAEIQIQCYGTLNMAATKLGERKLSKPNYRAFEEYDIFLKNNMSKNQYEDIEKKRKEVGLKV